jgi:hypothetical protein
MTTRGTAPEPPTAVCPKPCVSPRIGARERRYRLREGDGRFRTVATHALHPLTHPTPAAPALASRPIGPASVGLALCTPPHVYAGTQHVVKTTLLRWPPTGAPRPLAPRSMHDPAYGLPRTPTLGIRVNRRARRRAGAFAPRPSPYPSEVPRLGSGRKAGAVGCLGVL